MHRAEHGWVGIAFGILTVLGLICLLLPILMMLPLSIEDGSILRFPPETISLRWYGEFFSSKPWLRSTALSFEIATGAALMATVLGTLAAVGLRRASPPLQHTFTLLLMSPLFLPTIVVAVAIYGMYASLHLVGRPLGIVLAHGVLTLPFVVLCVSTAMTNSPRSLEETAMSLGAGPRATFFQVTVPLVSKGIAAGGVFAFLVSFDEIVITMFLSGPDSITLSKRMLDGVFYEITPMVAAVSCLLIGMNAALATLGFLLARSYR